MRGAIRLLDLHILLSGPMLLIKLGDVMIALQNVSLKGGFAAVSGG